MHTMLIESRRRKQRKMNRVRQIAAESKRQLEENEPVTTPREPAPAEPPVQEPEPIEPPNLPTDPHDLAHELQQEPKDQEATDEALENVEEKKRGKPKQRR